MTTEQWNEMTEGMKDEPSVVTDFLETMYDDLTEQDVFRFYEEMFDMEPEEEEKEAAFEQILSELYEMIEERPKEFYQLMQKVKKQIVRD